LVLNCITTEARSPGDRKLYVGLALKFGEDTAESRFKAAQLSQ
jgi:hypothetical protein